MYPSAVWFLLALSAYRQPYNKEPGVQRYVAITNEIGYRLQREQSYQQGNQVLSPYGVSQLLSVLYQGSTGRTQQQIGRLGYRVLEQQGDDISQSYQQLRRYLQSGSRGSQFEEATAVLYPSDYSVSPQYQQVLESSYQCLVQQVDYRQGSESATQDVNRWVQEQTRGRISQIADVDVSSGIQLLNGVYYRGSLQSQSAQQQVQYLPFYNEGDSSPQSVLYYQTQSRYPYYQDQQLQAVKIPYQGGDYSLLVVLPTQQNSVQQLQQQVSSVAIQSLLRNSQETQVRLSLPQFKLDYSRYLEQDVQSLGITSIFGARAELQSFSSGRNTYVSQIAQRTVVQVGEYGSGQQYLYEVGQEDPYEGQLYGYRAGQGGQYGGQQYRAGWEGKYEDQGYGYRGSGQGGQYKGQQYGYRDGQSGQYGDERYGYDDQQYRYGSKVGQENQYSDAQGQTGQRDQYQYGGRQERYGGEQHQYQYGSGQEGQYGLRQQHGFSGADEVAEFRVDRPFLFYVIHEQTGLNVVAGRITQL